MVLVLQDSDALHSLRSRKGQSQPLPQSAAVRIFPEDPAAVDIGIVLKLCEQKHHIHWFVIISPTRYGHQVDENGGHPQPSSGQTPGPLGPAVPLEVGLPLDPVS